MLSVQNLKFTSKTRESFDYTFDGGTSLIIGIAGRASCGKTLLLSLLNGRANPSDGTISLRGTPVGSSFLKKAASVFPHTESVYDDTPREQIRHCRNGIVTGFIEKNLVHFFEDANLPRYALCESKRKIADIMQAASETKEILTLDNPDAALDPEQLSHLGSFLREYSIILQKTVVIASHNVTFLANCCNMIVFLKKGTVAAQMTPEKISEEMLADIYDVPASIAADISTGKLRINIETV